MRQHDVGDDVGHGRLTTPNLHFLFRKRLTGKPTRANPHTQNTFSESTRPSAFSESCQQIRQSARQLAIQPTHQPPSASEHETRRREARAALPPRRSGVLGVAMRTRVTVALLVYCGMGVTSEVHHRQSRPHAGWVDGWTKGCTRCRAPPSLG